MASVFLYFFAKLGVTYTNPATLMMIRYIISGIILFSISRKLIIDKNVLILAIFTTTSTIFWGYGLLYVSPAVSSVLSYTMPLFSMILAIFIINEKPNHYEIIGLIIGFLGLGIYGSTLFKGFTKIGMILTLINAVFWALFSIYYRKLSKYDPISLNATQFIIGSGFMGLIDIFSIRKGFYFIPSLKLLESIVYISTIGGAFQFLIWNYLLKLERVNKVTIFAYIIPVATTIIQALLYKSLPKLFEIIGLLIMISGVIIARLKG
ncbi:DMT family transporter [Caldisphaera lagunensis]|uniref:DMT family transporter n=1 Tax=Caldisphaera lagunensis TaxID=200415 RepID=UPI001FE22163|nr:DMT family transporter [Caldisphaera lagunensis]